MSIPSIVWKLLFFRIQRIVVQALNPSKDINQIFSFTIIYYSSGITRLKIQHHIYAINNKCQNSADIISNFLFFLITLNISFKCNDAKILSRYDMVRLLKMFRKITRNVLCLTKDDKCSEKLLIKTKFELNKSVRQIVDRKLDSKSTIVFFILIFRYMFQLWFTNSNFKSGLQMIYDILLLSFVCITSQNTLVKLLRHEARSKCTRSIWIFFIKNFKPNGFPSLQYLILLYC